MDIESYRDFCLSLKGTTEDFPFDEDTLAFRVGGKIYALTSVKNQPFRVNLKCDPEKAIGLREAYESVIPGYHMNKKHWNTVFMEQGDIADSLLRDWIEHSYSLILKSLTKKLQHEILS